MEGILSQSESEDTDSENDLPELDSEEEFDGIEDEQENEELLEINGISALEATSADQELEEDDDKPNYVVTKDANGGERYEYQEIGELIGI